MERNSYRPRCDCCGMFLGPEHMALVPQLIEVLKIIARNSKERWVSETARKAIKAAEEQT